MQLHLKSFWMPIWSLTDAVSLMRYCQILAGGKPAAGMVASVKSLWWSIRIVSDFGKSDTFHSIS